MTNKLKEIIEGWFTEQGKEILGKRKFTAICNEDLIDLEQRLQSYINEQMEIATTDLHHEIAKLKDKGLEDKPSGITREELEGMKRENIVEKRRMCCEENPQPCLYDEADGNETCVMQDKKIPKEKCKSYKKVLLYEEDYSQYNQAIDDIIALLPKEDKK